MRDGDVWQQLRRLVDAAENAGSLSCSLDAHSLECGALRTLAGLGEDVLLSALSSELRKRGRAGAQSQHEAWGASRDDRLALLFESVGLDGRLRRHGHALEPELKADAVRAIAGELDRSRQLAERSAGGRVASAVSSRGLQARELLRRLAEALLDLHRELRAPAKASLDRKLALLLLSGSAAAIATRIKEMYRSRAARLREQLWLTVTTTLPRLNGLRLLVFVQVLQGLSAPPPGEFVGSPTEQAHLASLVVAAALASGLTHLPYEATEQLVDITESPYLGDEGRRELGRLLVRAEAVVRAPHEFDDRGPLRPPGADFPDRVPVRPPHGFIAGASRTAGPRPTSAGSMLSASTAAAPEGHSPAQFPLDWRRPQQLDPELCGDAGDVDLGRARPGGAGPMAAFAAEGQGPSRSGTPSSMASAAAPWAKLARPASRLTTPTSAGPLPSPHHEGSEVHQEKFSLAAQRFGQMVAEMHVQRATGVRRQRARSATR